MTFEERLKETLGDLHFALLVQSQQNDDLRVKLAKAEAQLPKDKGAPSESGK